MFKYLATLTILATVFCLPTLFAQAPIYVGKYATPENPHYWKNNPLLPKDYWQQDVAYTIKATINDAEDVIEANEFSVVYTNHSPHALKEVYFHLYENAFQPQSYYHQLWRANKLEPKFGKKEAQKLGTVTENWLVDGQAVITELDNTLLKVKLNKPLLPGESIALSCQFKTYWDTGEMRRRNKTYQSFGYKHFDGVHWYPIVCVYDAHVGWHTDQHMDKEFYANFGSFDVWLTFPQEYVVEATGVLQNEEEVLPNDLKQKLQLTNFANKPFNSAPSVITPREPGKTKTWHYFATNVHNFAFTADPTYRFQVLDWRGVQVIALAQEPHAARWQKSADFTRQVMEVFSHDFGKYIWPKIIVADANDGMEYPMLTLDGGVYPDHQYLLAHEVGHMWFYGMVANNETFRACLDEGFTQFLTIWAMDKITGKKRFRRAPHPAMQKYTDSIPSRFERLYYPYLADVSAGYDMPLNTHSHEFNSGIRQSGGYRLVYHKTGVMLYNLRYVLGDSLFDAAMKHYVKKWTGAHPYPEDFQKAVTEIAQTDLTWFFNAWLETTKNIDYGIKRVKKLKKSTPENGLYEITFERLGTMRMPIDFTVKSRNGHTQNFTIPVSEFQKKTDATVLPKWVGWDKLNPTYTTVVTVPGKIQSVTIDTTHILADYYLLNNSTQFPYKIHYGLRYPYASWEKYTTYLRPALWWNAVDGLQIGAASMGNYFNQQHFQDIKVWYNTALAQDINQGNQPIRPFSIHYQYRYHMGRVWRQLHWENHFLSYGGLLKASTGFTKTFKYRDQFDPRSTKVFLHHTFLYREFASDTLYSLYPAYWTFKQLNSYFTAGIQRNYPLKKGNGTWTLEARTAGIAADFNYSYLQYTLTHHTQAGKFDLHYRAFARIGWGNTPLESALYLAGAAPEELINHKLTRATGFVPYQWLGYGANTNHFQMGGGLNIRGYAGYLAPVNAAGEQYFNHVGKSGISFNLEVDFDRLIPLKSRFLSKYLHIDPYLFHDMGMLTFEAGTQLADRSLAHIKDQQWGTLRMSTGIGLAYTLKTPNNLLKPLVLRTDFPLLLNATPAGTQNTELRYLIGLERSF